MKNDNWIAKIRNAEKIKKYSQTGEEGVLQFILNQVGYGNNFLVDIGAWDGFHLSNTRFFIEQGFAREVNQYKCECNKCAYL